MFEKYFNESLYWNQTSCLNRVSRTHDFMLLLATVDTRKGRQTKGMLSTVVDYPRWFDGRPVHSSPYRLQAIAVYSRSIPHHPLLDGGWFPIQSKLSHIKVSTFVKTNWKISPRDFSGVMYDSRTYNPKMEVPGSINTSNIEVCIAHGLVHYCVPAFLTNLVFFFSFWFHSRENVTCNVLVLVSL